ncbi:hypothetical protein E4U48_004616 [Claviceps purpurea]|nr:hypothetical protein E4U48_004616 [Claviceps purpurea]
MLPLSLLNAAQGHPMLVELKNGETLNGHLVQCDTWMNLTLREVVQTSPGGDNKAAPGGRINTYHHPPAYEAKINRNSVTDILFVIQIKYLRVDNDIIDKVNESQKGQQNFRGGRGNHGQSRADHHGHNARGGGGGGDRGRGGRGGGGGGGGGRGWRGGRGRGQ